jgi:hypothetical protein
MHKSLRVVSVGLLWTLGACGMEDQVDSSFEESQALEADRDRFGVAESFHTTGVIDRSNPFFTPSHERANLRDLPRRRTWAGR